jgi:hypothetical protein
LRYFPPFSSTVALVANTGRIGMNCTIDVTRAESDDSRAASFVMVSIVATAFLPFASILRVNVPESFAAKRSRQVARKPSLFERAICRQGACEFDNQQIR